MAGQLSAVRLIAPVVICSLVLTSCVVPEIEGDRFTTKTMMKSDQATVSVEEAIKYARQAQRAYRDWLDNDALLTYAVGAGAILAAGAALGLAAVGGHTTLVTALGAGAGTAVALDSWVLGKPTDARPKAYLNAVTELQCVITDATKALPKPIAGGSTASPALTRALATAKTDLGNSMANVANAIAVVEIEAANKQCANPNLHDAQLALARAKIQYHRAETVEARLLELPGDIVGTVQAIDVAAYTQAEASAPDISKLPSVSSVGTKSTSGAAAAGKPTPNPPFVYFVEPKNPNKAPPKAPPACPAISFADVTAKAKIVDDMLAGVVLPPAGFSECLKAPPTTTANNTGGMSPKPAPSPTAGAITALTVLPTTELLATPKKPQTISLSGGVQPYDYETVEAGVKVTAETGNPPKLNVETTRLGTMHILIGDMSGQEALITVESVPPPKPAK